MSDWQIKPEGVFKVPEAKLSLVERFVATLGGSVEKIGYRRSLHQIKIKGPMVTNDHGVAQRFQGMMQHFGGRVCLRQAEDSKRRTGGYRQVVTSKGR